MMLLYKLIIMLIIVRCGMADAQKENGCEISYEQIFVATDFSQEKKVFVDAFTTAYKDDYEHFQSIGIFDMHKYFGNIFDEEFLQVVQQLKTLPPIYLVEAKVNRQVAGLITFNEEEPHQVYIRWLAISPIHGRLGLGKALVNYIKKILPHTCRLMVVAYKIDRPAMNFWKNKMNFIPSDYSRKEYDSATFQGFTYNFSE